MHRLTFTAEDMFEMDRLFCILHSLGTIITQVCNLETEEPDIPSLADLGLKKGQALKKCWYRMFYGLILDDQIGERRLVLARSSRIKHERDGMFYHVMTRTVQKAFLFEKPVIREWIYRKIMALGSIYFVDLHAVTVMSNHYHIVLAVRKPTFDPVELERRFGTIQSGRAYPQRWYEWRAKSLYKKLTDLSEFMKELNETVARHVNLQNQSRGHVWGDRFKSVLIEDGRGLLTCMAYIELNCVRAGLCDKPSEYRWCSVGRFFQGGAKQTGVSTPKLPGFEALMDERQRQRGFALFVDHLAERGKKGTGPKKMLV